MSADVRTYRILLLTEWLSRPRPGSLGVGSPQGHSTLDLGLTECLSLQVRAGVAQLVEHELPKLEVAGSNPVARSIPPLSRGFLFLLVVVAASACERSGRVPVTIVVDTDRSRVKQEQERLAALRSDVAGERRELEGARDDLVVARQKLVAAAAAARVGGAGAVDAGAIISRADLDAALAASELRLLAALAERAPATTTTATTATTAPSSTPSSVTKSSPADAVENARRDLAAARDGLEAKGLSVADVDGGVASVDIILRAIDRGDGAAAAAAAKDLVGRAAAVGVTRPVLMRKYERINVAAKRGTVSADKRAQAETQLRRASQALSAGDLPQANLALNAAAAAVGP